MDPVSAVGAPVAANLDGNDIGSISTDTSSIWSQALHRIGLQVHPLLILIGAITLLFLAFKKGSDLWPLPATAFGILIVWIFFPLIVKLPLLGIFQIHRTIGLFYYLIFISAAIGLELLAAINLPMNYHAQRLHGIWVIIALGLFLFLAVSLGAQTSQRMKDVVTSEHPAFQPYLQALKGLQITQGRILFEETYGQAKYPVNLSTLWGIAPLYTKTDVIHPTLRFFQHPYSGTQGGKLQGWRVDSFTQSQLLKVLETFNIEYIVTLRKEYTVAFRFLPGIELYHFKIYHNVATPVNFFRVENGTLSGSLYNNTFGRTKLRADQPTTLLFKVRYWSNWDAFLDGSQVPVMKTSQEYMQISIPAGNHVAEFRYGMRYWDYFGWILTWIGIISCFILLIPSRRV